MRAAYHDPDALAAGATLEALAAVSTRATPVPPAAYGSEPVNPIVKSKDSASGHGIRNFDNFRLRVLLCYGMDWHAPAAARISGRLRSSWEPD